MDPFNAPAWGSAPNYQADLKSTIASTAPLAQNWNGAQTGVAINQVFNDLKTSTPQPSNISKFFHFIGGIGSEIGHIGASATQWLGQQGAKAVTAPVRFVGSVGHDVVDAYDSHKLNASITQNQNDLTALNKAFRLGKISTPQYKSELKDITKRMQQTGDLVDSLSKRIAADTKNTRGSGFDTLADLTVILTGGVSKLAESAGTVAATKLLTSNAVPALDLAEQAVNKLATNPELFEKLAPAAQKAFQVASAEIVANNAGRMTAAQIGKATAANLAIKYPIYFNMVSTTAKDIYNKLDDKKYGDAMQSIAFNAALLLSGGPIGKALSAGGKVVSTLRGAAFGRTSFLDELSKGIGDGNPAGLFNAINKVSDPALKKEIIQNLSAVEATNMAAVVGKDPVVAAWRVLNGMSSYEGSAMNTFTHEEALNNMVNFAKAQRLVDETGKKLGLGPITVGRVDARALNEISAGITAAERPGFAEASKLAEPAEVDMSKAPDFLQPQGKMAGLSNKDTVFGQNGTAWKSYNERYSGISPQTAKSQVEFDAVSAGDPKVFNKTPDGIRLKDTIAGTKRVGYVDNQSYDELFAKKAKAAGLYTKKWNGITLAGKNKEDVLEYASKQDISKEREHYLIGYNHDNFVHEATAKDLQSQLPKGLAGAKPNYSYGQNRFTLNFSDDVTKSLYIVGGKGQSASHDAYMDFLRQALPDKSDAEIKAMGDEVRNGIKSQAKGSAADTINVKTHPASRPAITETQPASPVAPINKPTSLVGVTAQTPVEQRLSAWEAMKEQNPTQAWANNETLDKQITSLIKKHEDVSKLDEAIRGIKASFNVDGFPSDVSKELGKMGYLPIKPVNLEAPFQEGAGKLASKFAANDDFFLKAVQPLPVLSSMGSLLTKMGMSPVASSSRVYQMFNQNLAENLGNMKVIENFVDKGENAAGTADNIIKKLSDFAHHPTRGTMINGRPLTPITDLRQLTTKDIMSALDVSSSDASEVKGALMDSMLQVPLQVRGLGDKLVDANYKLNPLAGRYARVQGAARFSWNPFFQAKLAYKTELLAQAEVHGKFPTMGGTNKMLSIIFPDKYRKIDETRNLLRQSGIFDERARFGEGISGEAVNDVGIGGANLTHKLIPSQERSIASMVQVQADKVGLSTEDFVKNFPNEVRDTVQMIAQYDRNSEFLNSAMARTLNLAFFPFRFEYKVASIMARSLATTTPLTQLAVINGLYHANQWLDSTEGQAWYSQNSEVIGLIKYFTPIQTLAEVSNLLGGHPDSVGSFGELGGLPFGWIPQMLDAQGLTNFGGVYVSPKTGQALPDYVPASDKGVLASAIQDLVGSLFTYPGATIGAPSKTSIDRNIALGVTGATKKDFNKVTPDIPADQQGFAQTVQGLAHQTLQGASQPQVVPPLPGLQPGIHVPAQSSPLTTPVPKPAKAGGGKKKKKADYIPQLLPGQTQLGQLP